MYKSLRYIATLSRNLPVVTLLSYFIIKIINHNKCCIHIRIIIYHNTWVVGQYIVNAFSSSFVQQNTDKCIKKY